MERFTCWRINYLQGFENIDRGVGGTLLDKEQQKPTFLIGSILRRKGIIHCKDSG
jgi:hypothetical protein